MRREREAEASTQKTLYARLLCGEPQKGFRQGSRQLRLEFHEDHSGNKGSIDRRGQTEVRDTSEEATMEILR